MRTAKLVRHSSMLISLDYDNTYTADPAFWGAFIALAALRKVEIVICTFRAETHRLENPPPGIPVYYTAGVAKKAYMDSQGIKVDIWIDDEPFRIW
jgi:hypothetical protein